MYKKNIHIHFMGIGGIGMSGIAHVLCRQGYQVSGCDTDMNQKSIQQLIECGCAIDDHHDASLCHDPSISVLVYSSAITLSHPEIVRAQQRGIPVIPRALMLAELMRTKHSIAIAGAHGKTTTSAMISHILLYAGLDPTVIIGGHLKNIGSNAHYGHGDFLVAEADESDRSLLNLYASCAVITNIDLEHLDTYKDLDDILDTFKKFLNRLPFYGKAHICIDDHHIQSLLPLSQKTITYGCNNQADIRAGEIEESPHGSSYNLYHKNIRQGSISLPMAGKHNVLNSLGASSVALDLNVPFDIICKALASFQGIERRFSYHGTYNGAELFDDYAHHPKEIANILAVARKRSQGKLHVVFQPHRFSRTHLLWHDFIEAFSNVQIDSLIITDIFAASESPIDGITSQKLALELNQTVPTHYIPLDDNFTHIIDHLKNSIHPDDLVLFLGAGKVYLIPKVIR